jgi:hypothetical protein
MEVNSCKIWQGAKNRKGYGQKRIAGKLWIVSRLTWTLEHGDIPAGMCVLHRCDTPSCWEISHLFLGTHQDNADDKMRKGRHVKKNRPDCKFGHPFSEENTRIRSDGARQCRICERECLRRNYDPAKRSARYLAKKKGGTDGNHRISA